MTAPPRSVEDILTKAHEEIILMCGHDGDCPQEWEEFPDRYGPCNCQMAAVKTTLEDFASAYAAEQVAQAREELFNQMLTDGREAVTKARRDLFQILVNRTSCDLAGLEDVPSDASFEAMLDQLEFQARAEERESLNAPTEWAWWASA